MAESGNPQERLAAALAYVFTPVVPIVLLAGSARDNLFLKRHAAQALLWSIGLLILLVATVVLLIAMLRSTWLAICLLPVLIVVPFIPGAIMARIVYGGRDLHLPFITPLAERLFPSRRF
ncbi:MAG: DUF4870 domain-containing protein [Chloroflexota bacterium]|nr:DUF4870 domain-containing protein [Chloroflexota bacterium]